MTKPFATMPKPEVQVIKGLLVTLLPLLFLAGCEVTAPREPVIQGVQPTDWLKTATRLRAFDHWVIEGKISVRRDDRIDSGQIRSWTQKGRRFDIEIASVILGLGATRIWGDDTVVTIQQSGEDAVTLSENPETAFQRAFGWPLPVQQISSWIKGLPAQSGDGTAPALTFGEAGEIVGIVQDGWTVNLRKHQAVAENEFQSLMLPNFVQLTRAAESDDEVTVIIKMAISEWAALDE